MQLFDPCTEYCDLKIAFAHVLSKGSPVSKVLTCMKINMYIQKWQFKTILNIGRKEN